MQSDAYTDMLIQQYVQGDLGEEAAQVLLGLLHRDPALMDRLLDNVELNLLCLLEATPEKIDRPLDSSYADYLQRLEYLRSYSAPSTTVQYTPRSHRPTEQSPRRRFCTGFFQRTLKPRLRAICTALFFIVFACWGAYGVFLEWNREAKPPVFAHLTAYDAVVWSEDAVPLSPGDPIRSKRLRIDSGSLSMKLLDGAEIVLDGPGELCFDSRSELYLGRGTLSAEVPPQEQKLRVKTPRMNVDVLGTAFWVREDEKASEVHLLRGKVRIEPSSGDPQTLVPGEAFSVARSGALDRFEALSERFNAPEKLVVKMRDFFRRRETQLLGATGNDPSLLVLLDFHRSGSTAPNMARRGRDVISSAVVFGCLRVPGPDPEYGAIAFRRSSDRMILRVPQTLDSMTLAIRIKVDAEIKERLALLMSENFSKGSVRWMVDSTGKPVLNIGSGGKTAFENYGVDETVFADENIGRWVHLAVTLDASRRSVNWHLDGKRIGSQTITKKIPIRIDRALIGNWKARFHDADSFALYEFMLFERALSEGEIVKLASAQHFQGRDDNEAAPEGEKP